MNRDLKHNTGQGASRTGNTTRDRGQTGIDAGQGQESRPETQRGSRKTGKRDTRHTKRAVPRGGRVWIKRRGGTRVIEKESWGTKRRGRCKGEDVKGDRVHVKGKGVKGEGFKGDRVQDEGTGVKGDRVQDEGTGFKGDRVQDEGNGFKGVQDECQRRGFQRRQDECQMKGFQRRQDECQWFQRRGCSG
ncbi:hypothetical protein TNCV_5058101 [Trichonephila clavipes]|nr:hypothetical protein TNCV_5058101 [Trichonephila clavipes]